MNTLRYKPEYIDKAVIFLQTVQNTVIAPSDVFFDIVRLFENGQPDKAKLSKLLSNAYTVLALENEEIAGIAGMDNEGNIGIFAVTESENGGKCRKLLLNALERRAEKLELPYLFVLQTDACEQFFLSSGYKPFDNGSGGEDAINEFQLAKEIETKEKYELTPEAVKAITLDPKKRINVEGKFSTLPAVALGVTCFFMLILAAVLIGQGGKPLSGAAVSVCIVFSLLFVAALAVFTGYLVRGGKLKKRILSMRVTNAVVTCFTFDGIWDLNRHYYKNTYRTKIPKFTRVNLTYEYYDESMQKREGKYTHLYRLHGPYFFEGQELIIACKGENSYILRSYTILNQEGGQPEAADTDKPQNSDISEYVPLGAVRKYYFYSLSFLSVAAVLFLILIIFSLIASKQTELSFGWLMLDILPFMSPLLLMALIPAIYFLSVPLHTKLKMRKLMRQPDISFADGKLVFSENTYKSDNKFRFYCEYKDGGEKKRVPVPRFFVKRMVNKNENAAKVVFNRNTAVVLVRKDKFPNLFRQIR